MKLSQYIRPAANLLQARPLLAVFEVNLQCNSACGYCDLPLNKGRYELTREEIKRIFTGLYQYGLRYLFIQGGEPTLRKDLPGILADLNDTGFNLTLITNGTRLTRHFIDQIKGLPVNISVSLDSLDRRRYQAVRGADQLHLVLAGIDRLRDYPHPKYLTCIVSEQNRPDVMDVIRFAREKEFIPIVGAYHWDVGRYGRVDRSLQYRHDAVIKLFENILKSGLVPRGYYRDYIRDNIAWLRGERLNRCDAGRYSITIDASGNVAPCLSLNPGGNLREKTLVEILAGFDRDEINRCSDQSSCNMMCSRIVGSMLRSPVSTLHTPKLFSSLLK